MRFPLQVASAVREAWPADRAMSVKFNGNDWANGGFSTDESQLNTFVTTDAECWGRGSQAQVECLGYIADGKSADLMHWFRTPSAP